MPIDQIKCCEYNYIGLCGGPETLEVLRHSFLLNEMLNLTCFTLKSSEGGNIKLFQMCWLQKEISSPMSAAGPIHPGDLTCIEDCPDVCVQNRGKWVLFWPQGKE